MGSGAISMFKQTDIVVIPSKFCNLRCRYCYEFPELGDKRRMSLEQLKCIYENIASFHRGAKDPVLLRFIWHGGEPLLIPPEYYWQAFEMQHIAFAGTPCRITNSVQTNLTVLDVERIRLLRDGFDKVGVSLDLFGGLRVNKSGVCQEERSLKNLEIALNNGIAMGGITVLTKANLPYIRQIYQFYRNRGMHFRLLPLHKGPFDQNQGFEITDRDTLQALCELADLWFEDDQLILVEPIVQFIQQVLNAHLTNAEPFYYDKASWENILLVDVDGQVYGYNDPFDPNRAYGNLFNTPLEELLKSNAHWRVTREAQERMDVTCSKCEFYGKSCSGAPIAEGKQEYTERDEREAPICIAFRGFIQHIERRLIEAGVLDQATKILSPTTQKHMGVI